MIEFYQESENLFQLCEPDGSLDNEQLDLDLTYDFLTHIYRLLKYSRHFDNQAVNLQRQGRLGTYAPCRGQEAAQVGLVEALDDSDPLFPTYR
ncbi:MAG: thiamine pyrophosphate-dependent enzyme, partial [bacterium]